MAFPISFFEENKLCVLLVRYYFSFFPFCLLTYSLYTLNLVSAASYREGANVLNNTDGFLLKIFVLMVFPISFWLSLFHSKMFSDIKCSQLNIFLVFSYIPKNAVKIIYLFGMT